MKRNPLGRTGMSVSEICLGSMTWGTQNTEAEGHAQIDYAVEKGVNFIDTAELYPTTPVSAETQGRTEEIIGTWLEKSGKRSEIILATKVAGDGPRHIRGGGPITRAGIQAAVETSLARLKTDYIDLYQLHWPNRGSYHFRQNWGFDATKQNTDQSIAGIVEILEALNECVKAGKIRAIGLSNESAWGTMQFVSLAEKHGFPRVASIQNEYSLLCRHFDLDMAEVTQHEDVGLLAFSPLGAGLLTGKYHNGVIPAGSRRAINPSLGGRFSHHVEKPVEDYVNLAKKHGLDPAQMAISFCLSRPFMTSAIIGATTMEQLKTVISAADAPLSSDTLTDIAAIRRNHGMPM